jgi:hypothetical protein
MSNLFSKDRCDYFPNNHFVNLATRDRQEPRALQRGFRLIFHHENFSVFDSNTVRPRDMFRLYSILLTIWYRSAFSLNQLQSGTKIPLWDLHYTAEKLPFYEKMSVSSKWEQEGKTDRCDMGQYQRVRKQVTIVCLDFRKENHNRSFQRVPFFYLRLTR